MAEHVARQITRWHPVQTLLSAVALATLACADGGAPPRFSRRIEA